MSVLGIAIEPESCTGCHFCELICSFVHFSKSSIGLSRVIVYKDKSLAVFAPMLCVSCPGTPCVKACPTGALYVDETLRMPKVNEAKCSSCGECVKVCPYKAIRFERSVYAYPLICDLCNGDPQCVKVCWPGALTKATDLRQRYLSAVKSLKTVSKIEEG